MGKGDTLTMKISVMLPAYQEAENLKIILPELKNTLDKMMSLQDYEIIVVDTMESMDTAEKVCEDNGARYVHRRGGNSYGDAIRTGINEALGYYFVVMDADGSHSPKDIKRFYEVMLSEKCDLVIGSRYCEGGDTDNPRILKFMSWVLNITYRVLFRLNVKDVSDSYRMYKSSQIKELRLECDNFDIVEEILIKLNIKNKLFKIIEVPIYFNKRAYGTSKRDLGRFIISYISTIRKLKRIEKNSMKEEQR